MRFRHHPAVRALGSIPWLVFTVCGIALLSACSEDLGFTGLGDACVEAQDCDEGVCMGGVCQPVRPPASGTPPTPPPGTAPGTGTDVTSGASGTVPSRPATEGPTAGGETEAQPSGVPGSQAASTPVVPSAGTSPACDGADLNNDPENCGTCGRVCSFAQGFAGCSGGVCLLASCQEGWRNCDDNPQTGCETPVLDDPTNCGGCEVTCPAEDGFAICEGGWCRVDRCPSGERVCDGKCAPANPCGGCDETGDLLPGDPCAECGAQTCVGDALQCVSPDFESDALNCGGCGLACEAGERCESGTCRPAPREIERVWVRNVFGETNAYRELQAFMEGSRGYSVTRGSRVNESVLNSADLILVDMFAARDLEVTLDRMEEWVEAGGMLVFVGYTGRLTVGGDQPSDDPDRCALMNPLMERFGMRFSDVATSSARCSGGNFNSVNIFDTTVASHPLTSDPALTRLNLSPRSGWRIRTLDSAISEPVAWIRTNDPIVQVAELGLGRVIALADGRPARGMVDSNRAFWLRAFDWLRFAL